VIIGARTDEQLADNLAAADLVLTDEQRARLDEVSQEPLRYPHWHQLNTASDRLGAPDLTYLRPYL
jgi:diketogulonate reductase-like aldo/keto reductase